MTRRLFVPLTAVILTLGCARGIIDYNLPEGYVGSVVITYENPKCEPSKRARFKTIIEVGPDGIACTSDRRPPKSRWTHFYYKDSGRELKATKWGGGGMIWGEAGPTIGHDQRGPLFPTYHFFVGSEEQFRASYGRGSNTGGSAKP